MTALTGIAAILSLLAILMGGVKLLQQRCGLMPETTRKLVHCLMGLSTLSFPWLFDWQIWPVVGLAVLSIAMLTAIQNLPPLQTRLSSVLNAVERDSWGIMLFPVGVVLVYALAERQLLWYVIPVLLLTLADAVAALVGVRYGTWHYDTSDGRKSWEGSSAFLLTAFLSVHIPVLLFSPVDRAESLLMAGVVALLVMWIEGIAWCGLDNLLIPLGALFFLKRYWLMPAAALWPRLVGLASILPLFFLFRRTTTLKDSALIAALLMSFGAWALGGLTWALPPLLLLSTHLVLTARERRRGRTLARQHGLRTVLTTGLAGVVWLAAHQVFPNPTAYLLCFSLGFACHGGLLCWFVLRHRVKGPMTRALVSTLLGGGLVWLPSLVLATLWPAPQPAMAGAALPVLAGAGLLVVMGCQGGYLVLARGVPKGWDDRWHWLVRGAWVGVCSATAWARGV